MQDTVSLCCYLVWNVVILTPDHLQIIITISSVPGWPQCAVILLSFCGKMIIVNPTLMLVLQRTGLVMLELVPGLGVGVRHGVCTRVLVWSQDSHVYHVSPLSGD